RSRSGNEARVALRHRDSAALVRSSQRATKVIRSPERAPHRECPVRTRVDPSVNASVRWSLGIALVIALPLVGAGLARAGYDLDQLPALRDTGPITVVLRKAGGQALAGTGDPRREHSGVVARQALDWGDGTE